MAIDMTRTAHQKVLQNLLRAGALAMLCLGSWTAHATHLVGGEIFYTHLGGNNYLITLKVYRDCGPANTLGTGFDDQVYIGMWDGNGNIGFNDVLTIPLSFSNISSVPVVLGNPCGTPPPDLCIEEAIYSTQVTLPPNPYGWDLVWQRCCRNPSIDQQPAELRRHREPWCHVGHTCPRNHGRSHCATEQFAGVSGIATGGRLCQLRFQLGPQRHRPRR